jgi:hypothetical protein
MTLAEGPGHGNAPADCHRSRLAVLLNDTGIETEEIGA